MDHKEVQNKQIKKNEEDASTDVKEVSEAIQNLLLAMQTEHESAKKILEEKAETVTALEEHQDKEKLAQIRQCALLEKKFVQAKLQNQKLKDILGTSNQELLKVQEQYNQYVNTRAKVRLEEKMYKAQKKGSEKKLRELLTEHILLRNAVEKLEEEKDKLKKEHMRKVLDCKMKSMTKDMRLEKRVAALTEELEKKSPAANTPVTEEHPLSHTSAQDNI